MGASRFCKSTWRLEIAATQTMSAYADCLKTLALRVRVCIASDFDAVGNLQLWDAPNTNSLNESNT